MSRVTEGLHKHHAYCDDFFVAAEQAAQDQKWANCKFQFGLFQKELETHFLAEESILFPAFEEASGMTGGPSHMMRIEHEQMRELMAEIARAIESENGAAYEGAADTLLILMQQHNAKEENILYPMCDSALGQQEAADIGRRLEHYLEGAG